MAGAVRGSRRRLPVPVVGVDRRLAPMAGRRPDASSVLRPPWSGPGRPAAAERGTRLGPLAGTGPHALVPGRAAGRWRLPRCARRARLGAGRHQRHLRPPGAGRLIRCARPGRPDRRFAHPALVGLEVRCRFPLQIRRSARPDQFRRVLRELRSLPGFETRTATTPEEIRPALGRLLALHAKRWSGQGGSDAIASPAVKAFHQDAAQRLARAGIARIEELWIDGACRAAYYGMQSGNRYYLYQTGFDREWARRSVAFIRLGLSIQEAANRGVTTYDLLRGNETCKFDWANATRITVRVQVSRRSLAPALFVARRELGSAAKLALKAGLPAPGLEWLRRRRRSWEQREQSRPRQCGRESDPAPQPLANAPHAHL